MKWFLLFVWVELILLFSLGCSGPKEKRGDWMEHLNYRQFTYNPPSIHWDRHNYYTIEELHLLWEIRMEEAMSNLNTEED